MKRETGQTLALVAVLMVVLLGMVALAIDGGNAYMERRQMQTAADAGALAAARARCFDDPDWDGIGRNQCYANKSDPSTSCDVGGEGGRFDPVWATASESVPTWFAGIVGVDTITVGARAEATCSTIDATGNLVPLTIDIDDFAVGSTYAIWYKDNKISGDFGWLQWHDVDEGCRTNSGNDRLRYCIENPWCAPMVGIGAVEDSEPGVNKDSLDTFWTEHKCEVVVVPLYSYHNTKDKEYTIAGFGAFLVTGYCDGNKAPLSCGGVAPSCDNKDTKITGQFVKFVNPESLAGGDDTGVYMVYLTD